MADEPTNSGVATAGETPTPAPASIPGNSPGGETATPGKPGIVAGILAKLPGKKRGPKGPWKHKEGASQPSIPAPVAPVENRAVLPPGFIQKTLKGFLGVIDGFLCRKVYTTTEKLSGDKNLANQFAAEVAMTKDESALIADLGEVVMKKYGLDDTSPEILLGIALGGYGVRVGMVMYRLEELGKLNARKNAAQPQANENSSHGKERDGQV